MRRRLSIYLAIFAALLGFAFVGISYFLITKIDLVVGSNLETTSAVIDSEDPAIEIDGGERPDEGRFRIIGDGGRFDFLLDGKRAAHLRIAGEPLTLIVPILVVAAMITAAGFLFGASIVRRTVRPIEDLTSWLAGPGAATTDPPSLKDPELRMLARSLKEALTIQEQQVSRERAFVREASHELYTPISIIRAVCDLGAKRPLDDKEMDRIRRSAVRMEHTVEGLLWLEKAERQVSGADFRAEFDSLIEETRERFSGDREVGVGLEIETEPDTSLSARMLVLAGGTLLRNAFQHSKASQVSIRVDEQRFEISDNGEGFKNIEATMDALRRLQPVPGGGLGLSLVERICRRMEWHFELQSGHAGTVASIRLDGAS